MRRVCMRRRSVQGQFHSGSSSDALSHEGYGVAPTRRSAASQYHWPLAREIQQWLGEDSQLDPLFFEEIWTLGMPAAVENRRLRYMRRTEQEAQRITFRELDNFGILSFVQTSDCPADFVPRGHAATIARCYDACWQQASPDETTSRIQDQPPPCSDASPDNTNSSQPVLHPATHVAARQLLGVTINSSEEQIKAAYRQRVRQWHPDLLQHRSDEVRRFANQQMAAINQAYCMLRSELPL